MWSELRACLSRATSWRQWSRDGRRRGDGRAARRLSSVCSSTITVCARPMGWLLRTRCAPRRTRVTVAALSSLLRARSTCVGSSSRLERRRWTRSCGPGRRIGCACRSDSCRVPQTTKLQPPLTLHRTVQTPDQFTSRSVRSPNLSRGRGEAPATLFSLPTCPPLSSRHTKRHALLQCAKGMRRQSTPAPLSSLLSLPRRARTVVAHRPLCLPLLSHARVPRVWKTVDGLFLRRLVSKSMSKQQLVPCLS